MSKNIKRSVLFSAFCTIALCLCLVAGATFAWFTDTAKTNVNEIKSGTLDVTLQMQNDEGEWVNAEGETLSFLRADAEGNRLPDASVLWEPGCTYYLPTLRVVNKGNLALKYKMVLSGATGDLKLLDALTFTAEYEADGENRKVSGVYGSVIMEGTLEAVETDNVYGDEIRISAVMDKEAGNEYQNLTVQNVAVTVYATQAPVEYDSNGNQYDADASAIVKYTGGEHVLDTGAMAFNANEIAVKVEGKGTKLTINGGKYYGGEGGNNQCIQVEEGATLIINDGYFTVGKDATGEGNSVIENRGGTIEINGGFFETKYHWRNFYYVLNQLNSNPGTITVKGGTFVNYNPAKGDDNLGGNFVADGYMVTEKQVGTDTWYTVVLSEDFLNSCETDNIIDPDGEARGAGLYIENVKINAAGKTVFNLSKQYSTVWLVNSTLSCKDVIASENAQTVWIWNCDITLEEGGKLVSVGGYANQIILVGDVYVNGVNIAAEKGVFYNRAEKPELFQYFSDSVTGILVA